ncbi:hypothetical protein CO134_03940 [Candidatus Kuenenbacteria bacterium CG_4_9_14_3_um_filter_39_14]|uniref:Transposase IS30-like HTH domain-containing protein n=5 Tax=Candidatus Kueneniibacteriota TaxID=1752740 RepID=A0A2M7ILY2_9BACT|nr:MAG: hypothetical protein COX28_00840 [Candidatus Kuenenbacteria bacterium CG23_combo_of_CG06-09_8_20_14_all_39_39]PIP75433.1 MAG: hypothetical protein COW86_03785 [Candidatus Kuenenbacteria bacterium CG22_combo_CG10-13_8_21_14_all_39_9]PIW95842.1 MAG: hypothetical protein COZ84_01290 [Candidatus Kuenenbacteria bacterium CG_4_8_14_3_um_filter_39_15]PIX92441.1 MAG: hypothetical protein COZ26_01800 [Candidatus Kuenenbacteria bacterium CG_4_10_14_3_um_filter_39_14]PJA91715.1 MAG: hypothetical p
MDNNTLESTNKLLRVIVALLLKRKDPDTLTLRQQIEILNDLGLKPLEIAEILGRSNIYINKELFELRKSRKQK